MTFKKYLEVALREGFHSDISTSKVLVVLTVAVMIGLYIYGVYRFKSKSSFYSKDFNCVLAILPAITASIVLAMQSSIVISLGMVGALSIVRFRNAVKNSLDLLFLFWTISVGIIVGASLFEIALTTSLVVTILMLVLDMIPVRKAPYVLIIHANSIDLEGEILPVIKRHCKAYTIRSREKIGEKWSLIVEVRTNEESILLDALSQEKRIAHVNLLAHDGVSRY